MDSQIRLELEAVDKGLSRSLKEITKESKATFAEMKSLERMKSIGIKVNGQEELKLTEKNAANLASKLDQLKQKKEIQIQLGSSSIEISKLNTQINSLEASIAIANKNANFNTLNESIKTTEKEASILKERLSILSGNTKLNITGQEKIGIINETISVLKANITSLEQKKVTLFNSGDTLAAKQIENEILKLDSEIIKLNADAKSFTFGGQFKELTGGLQGITDRTKTAGESLSGFASKALLPVGAALYSAANKTADYETSVGKLQTVTNLSIKDNNDFANSLRKISDSTNTSSITTMEATYQGFSSSLFKTKKDATDLMPQLQKLSKVGFTDLTSATDLTSTALNAFHLPVQQASKVMDQFLQAQNKGKLTINDLAHSLGQIAPTSYAAGASLQDVDAMLIQMTKSGISTAESGTKITAFMGELLKPSTDLAPAIEKVGISLSDFEKQGGTLPQYLQKLVDASGKTSDEFAKLFSSKEAMNTFQVSAQNGFKDLAASLDDVNKADGSLNKTYGQWIQSNAGKIDSIKSKFEQFSITLGEALLPKVQGLVDWFAKLSPADIDSFVSSLITFGKVMGTVFVVGKIMSWGSSVISTLSTVKNVLSTFGSGFSISNTLSAVMGKEFDSLSGMAQTKMGMAGQIGGTALLGGLVGYGISQVAIAMSDMLGNQLSESQSKGMEIGSSLGGAIGAGAGMVLFGPVGSMIGTALGSGLGALVGSQFGYSYGQELQMKTADSATKAANTLSESFKSKLADATGVITADVSQKAQIMSNQMEAFSVNSGVSINTLKNNFMTMTNSNKSYMGEWVAFAASSSDSMKNKLISSMTNASNLSKEQLQGLIDEFVSTGKLQAHPELNIKDDVFKQGITNASNQMADVNRKHAKPSVELLGANASIQSAQQIKNSIDSIPLYKKVSVAVSSSMALERGHASGGPLKAGQTSPVNERGQESVSNSITGQTRLLNGSLYTAQQGDTINTAQQTSKMLENQQQPRVFNITINGSNMDPSDIVDVIKNYERYN